MNNRQRAQSALAVRLQCVSETSGVVLGAGYVKPRIPNPLARRPGRKSIKIAEIRLARGCLGKSTKIVNFPPRPSRFRRVLHRRFLRTAQGST
jgi:hypothetical protein